MKGNTNMDIKDADLGKIVQLPARPEWGLGIISKIEIRFAFILFRDAEDKTPKKYYKAENPLVLSKEQNQPDLIKRARVKNKKIKAVPVAAALPS